GRTVEPLNFLLGQTKTLDQLDITKRFRRRTGQRRTLGDDLLLQRFDLPAERQAQYRDDGNRQEVSRANDPVHAECNEHDEHDSDERNEQKVDRSIDQSLEVDPYLLQLSQCFAAALVLEKGIG